MLCSRGTGDRREGVGPLLIEGRGELGKEAHQTGIGSLDDGGPFRGTMIGTGRNMKWSVAPFNAIDRVKHSRLHNRSRAC